MSPEMVAVVQAIESKANSSDLDHLTCSERIHQAVIDTFLVCTDPTIRTHWLNDLGAHHD